MGKVLTEEQIARYRDRGAVYPVPLLSKAEARAYRARFEALEATIGEEAQKRYRIKAHLPFPWLWELIRHPRLADAIEDLVGPDIVCWGTSFFTKKAHDHRFVSWHQDSTYYGLKPAESLTAWIAFSDASIEAGCMRYIPGSHDGPDILQHRETWSPDNLLSRGQTIDGVDERKAAYMPLAAGEFSIHHNRLIHSSEPNRSDDARIGFTVHFAPVHVRQIQFDNATAIQIRGRDAAGYWVPDPEPRFEFDPVCMEALDEYWARYKRVAALAKAN